MTTETPNENTERTASRAGGAIMVSYKELVAFNTELANIKAMLTAALALHGQVADHAKRLNKIEVQLARGEGASQTWTRVLTFLGGAVTTAVGGGALMYLPKFWGG
jgi:hypothetical protein